MKNIIILVVSLMMCLFANCLFAADGCRVLEYAEIKDMTDTELQSEMDKNKNEVDYQQESSLKWAALSGRYAGTEQQKAWNKMVSCREQNDRLISVMQKRLATKPTIYDECVERLKKVSSDAAFLKNCDKYKKD